MSDAFKKHEAFGRNGLLIFLLKHNRFVIIHPKNKAVFSAYFDGRYTPNITAHL